MKALITGISGQIGSRLSEVLTDLGIEHLGIDVATSDTTVPFLRADLSCKADEGKIRNFISGVTHVFHLSGTIYDDNNFHSALLKQFQGGAMATTRLLGLLPPETEHICFASSMMVYGAPLRTPVYEGDILNPVNCYALDKIASEQYLKLFCKQKSISCAILRYSSIYGPGKISSRAIPNMIESVLAEKAPYVINAGSTYRDYMYIDDAVNATVAASTLCATGTFNIGTGVATKTRDLANKIINILNSNLVVENRDGLEDYSFVYSIEKMESELDYSPRVSIDTGLREKIKWHLSLKEKIDLNSNFKGDK